MRFLSEHRYRTELGSFSQLRMAGVASTLGTGLTESAASEADVFSLPDVACESTQLSTSYWDDEEDDEGEEQKHSASLN